MTAAAFKSDLDWQEKATCITSDPVVQLAFTGGITRKAEAVSYIWEYCSGCPVRHFCRDWAGRQGNFSGIAGGYLWQSKGNGNDYTKPVDVGVPAAPPGTLTAWNRDVHPRLRKQHWVKAINGRSWISLCGAKLTATKGADEEREVEKAPFCDQCERMKPRGRQIA
jgi:hypothetical protein